MIKTTAPIFKRKGKVNFIKTVMGIEFNPLNVLPENIDVRDICHVLSRIPIQGGHQRSFYSLAEISVMNHDFLMESYNSIMVITEKNVSKEEFKKIQTIPLSLIRWMCLLQHSPLAYITGLQLSEFNREVHYFRILTSVLKSLCIYHHKYKEALLTVRVSEELLYREMKTSMFHTAKKELPESDRQKIWGNLYKRLSKDEILFKSDGSIRYV